MGFPTLNYLEERETLASSSQAEMDNQLLRSNSYTGWKFITDFSSSSYLGKAVVILLAAGKIIKKTLTTVTLRAADNLKKQKRSGITIELHVKPRRLCDF